MQHKRTEETYQHTNHIHRQLERQELPNTLLDIPSPETRSNDRSIVIIKEDDITGILDDLRAVLPHSERHIGDLEARRIIRAITCHSDYFILCLKRFHELKFLFRTALGDNFELIHTSSEVTLTHLGDAIACRHSTSVIGSSDYPRLKCDGSRCGSAIAGYHTSRHTSSTERSNCARNFRSNTVLEEAATHEC